VSAEAGNHAVSAEAGIHAVLASARGGRTINEVA
jgi:hypothetical protein